MISKVKHVQPNGTWDSPHGMLYKYEYTMESGETLVAMHKKEGGNFQIGAEVDYEITKRNEHGNFGKVRKPESANYSGSNNKVDDSSRQLMIVRQSSLKCATDILIHNCEKVNVNDVEVLAERLTGWVMDSPKDEPKANHAEQIKDKALELNEKLTNPEPPASEEEDDGLPF